MAKGNTTLQKQRRQQRQQTLPRLDCPCGVNLLPTDANIYAHRKTAKHQAWETETGFPTPQLLADIQMKKSSWITALKEWNKDKPSWCMPRKGTEGYNEVLALKMNHTQAVTFQPDTTDSIDIPTYKPKRVVKAQVPTPVTFQSDTSDAVDIPTYKPKPKRVKALVPVDPPKPTKTRMEEIAEQLNEEAKTGLYSTSYDLGWKPDTTMNVISGADRRYQVSDYKYVLSLPSKPDVLDISKLTDFVKEHKSDKEHKSEVAVANRLIVDVPKWTPTNAYYSYGNNYNTKTKTIRADDDDIKKALEDYQEFADEVNKFRGTPIRNITIRTKFYEDGRRTLTAEWTITRSYSTKYSMTYSYFVREYQTRPEFKFLDGATIAKMKAEEQAERDAVKSKQDARKHAEETDPRKPIKEAIAKLEAERKAVYAQYPKNAPAPKDLVAKERRLSDEIEKLRKEVFALDDILAKVKKTGRTFDDVKKEMDDKEAVKKQKETERDRKEKEAVQKDIKAGKFTERVYYHELRTLIDDVENDRITSEEYQTRSTALRQKKKAFDKSKK